MPELNREQIIAELQEIIDHFAGSLNRYWTLSNALTLIKQLTEENESLGIENEVQRLNLGNVRDDLNNAEYDVVRLKQENTALECEVIAKIATTKQEVAREIFGEFETSLVIGGFVNGEKYLAIREDDYNHYKKKYIGENNG